MGKKRSLKLKPKKLDKKYTSGVRVDTFNKLWFIGFHEEGSEVIITRKDIPSQKMDGIYAYAIKDPSGNKKKYPPAFFLPGGVMVFSESGGQGIKNAKSEDFKDSNKKNLTILIWEDAPIPTKYNEEEIAQIKEDAGKGIRLLNDLRIRGLKGCFLEPTISKRIV